MIDIFDNNIIDLPSNTCNHDKCTPFFDEEKARLMDEYEVRESVP